MSRGRRRCLVAAFAAAGLVPSFGTSLVAGAGSDLVTPSQLYLTGGAQSFTVVVAVPYASAVSAVTLIDASVVPSCIAPAASFIEVSTMTVSFTDDPSESCLADGRPGDLVQIEFTVGSAVEQVDPVTPFTLAAVPAPTPSSSASPAPTPAAPTKPSPGPSLTPAPTRSRPAASPTLTPGSLEFSLTASSMTLTGLTYVGSSTIASGSVKALPVLEFTITGSSADNFTLTRSCSNTLQLESSIPSSASASFGGATLYVTDFSGTDHNSTLFEFKPGAAPTGALPATPYTGVSIVAAQITATELSLPNMTTTASFC